MIVSTQYRNVNLSKNMTSYFTLFYRKKNFHLEEMSSLSISLSIRYKSCWILGLLTMFKVHNMGEFLLNVTTQFKYCKDYKWQFLLQKCAQVNVQLVSLNWVKHTSPNIILKNNSPIIIVFDFDVIISHFFPTTEIG